MFTKTSKKEFEKPITFVIFGSTGDLTRSKILPALENLVKREYLGKNLNIVSVGRRDYDDKKYYEFISKDLLTDSLKDKIHYFKADAGKEEGLAELENYLSSKKLLNTNLIFYFATPQKLFPIISKELCMRGFTGKNNEFYRRFIFEKPFGESKESSSKLMSYLTNCFSKDQLFIIDHYLGKEVIQNLLVLRFLNSIYKASYSSEYIEKVRVVLDENKGIGDRGQYYDKAGVIKDMFQSHFLQILTFLTMKAPSSNNMTSLQRSKEEVIRYIDLPKDLKDNITLGQYEGYTSEKHVDPNSNTATYISLNLKVKEGPLKGVPLEVRTGKALREKRGYIEIEYKPTKNIFNKDKVEGNKIYLEIQPTPRMITHFNHKIPGMEMKTRTVDQHFDSKNCFPESPVEGYERLFYEIILGRHLLFPTTNEVRYSWDLTDRLLRRVEKLNIKRKVYKKRSSDV